VGILNDYEKQKCIEAFNIYDKNGSKRLEKDELRIVLEGKVFQLEMGFNPTDEELNKMVTDVDSTGDGAISLFLIRYKRFYESDCLLEVLLRAI
jgi:Ca2+-binding EF-hand superfamily protein